MSLSEVYPLIQSLHNRIQVLETHFASKSTEKGEDDIDYPRTKNNSVNRQLNQIVLQWMLKRNEREEMGYSLPFSLALHKAENRVYVRVKTESDPVFYITLQKRNTYNLIKITKYGESMIIKDASPYKIFETLEQKSQEIIARNRLPKQ